MEKLTKRMKINKRYFLISQKSVRSTSLFYLERDLRNWIFWKYIEEVSQKFF